jgi:adenine phosphoribosyltransferase
MTTSVSATQPSAETLTTILSAIRDVPDFPKPGILFKDITPIFQQPDILNLTLDSMIQLLGNTRIDTIAGIESRGFLFGVPLAQRLNLPFVPIRKKGKLPAKVVQQCYDLEYGTDCIELHADAIPAGHHVLVVDDLLATGGTARAAEQLIAQVNAHVSAHLFMVELGALAGRQQLSAPCLSLLNIAD